MADKALKSIINDRTSGASEIERRIYVYLMSALRIYRDKSIRDLIDAMDQIRQRYRPMANIVKILDKVEKSIGKDGLELIRENLALYKKDIEKNRQLTIRTTSLKIRRFDSIFTLSNSSLIGGSILEAKNDGWEGEVKIVESRPLNEGVLLATDLSRAGVQVTLAVDANIPELVKESKAIFLGADALTPTYFVNKTGSAITLEFAAKYRKPVFVMADMGKIISDRLYKFIRDENPAREIIPGKPRKIAVVNNYFERVLPLGKTRYIIGDKIINPPDVKNLLKQSL